MENGGISNLGTSLKKNINLEIRNFSIKVFNKDQLIFLNTFFQKQKFKMATHYIFFKGRLVEKYDPWPTSKSTPILRYEIIPPSHPLDSPIFF